MVAETLIPGLSLSEADVVRMLYRLLAEESWTCPRIADHLNALGIPPVYTRDNRQLLKESPQGKRKAHTAGIWSPARVRNLVMNTVYKGEHYYGKRGKKSRDLIQRAVPAIVPVEIWEQAQHILHSNMIMSARNGKRQYLLRGYITCGLCGLTYGECTRPEERQNGCVLSM